MASRNFNGNIKLDYLVKTLANLGYSLTESQLKTLEDYAQLPVIDIKEAEILIKYDSKWEKEDQVNLVEKYIIIQQVGSTKG